MTPSYTYDCPALDRLEEEGKGVAPSDLEIGRNRRLQVVDQPSGNDLSLAALVPVGEVRRDHSGAGASGAGGSAGGTPSAARARSSDTVASMTWRAALCIAGMNSDWKV